MFKVRVIPCLDVKDGRVVKGVKFVDLRDAGDPVEAAIAYDAAGADELCFLDITASHEKRGIILDVVRRTAEACFMPLTVGGGVRTIEDIRALLASGADKVSINTAAVDAPRLRARGGGEIRRPVHRRRDRRQEGVAAGRARRAGRSSPMAAASRPGSMRSTMRARWWRSAPAKSCSPPWIATAPGGLRHRADPRGRRRRAGAGDRLGRRRHARPSGRGHSRRPCHRGAGRLDLPLRRVLRARGQGPHGGRRAADAARSLSVPAFAGTGGERDPRRAERALQAMIAPEHFAVGGDEGRRAEEAEFCASSVCALSRALMASDWAAASTGCGADVELRQHVGENRGIVDAASVRRTPRGTHNAKIFAPAVIERHQRDARRQQTVLGKRIGTVERHDSGPRTAARDRATYGGLSPDRD